MRHSFPLMLFAAGFGTRMGPLTQSRPKPLISVAGRPLIDHALALADGAGISRMVANVHYLADQIETHLADLPISISDERAQILDTGGGLLAALPLLGPGPVMTLNTDAVWTGQNPLTQLDAAWDDQTMDVLFLVLPAEQAMGTTGRSDFVLDDDGRITWAKGRSGCLYLGAQIINPSILSQDAGPAFSLHGPWTRAIEAGRAFGVVHKGGWCDVGHPGGIAVAEAMLETDQDIAHVRN